MSSPSPSPRTVGSPPPFGGGGSAGRKRLSSSLTSSLSLSSSTPPTTQYSRRSMTPTSTGNSAISTHDTPTSPRTDARVAGSGDCGGGNGSGNGNGGGTGCSVVVHPARRARALLIGTFAMLLIHQSHLAYMHHAHATDHLHLDLLHHHDAALATSHLRSSLAAATTRSTASADDGDDDELGDGGTPNKSDPREITPLPAIVPSDTSVSDSIRKVIKMVSGTGDPVHLGGKVDFPAAQSISPSVFQLVRSQWGATSLLDVGALPLGASRPVPTPFGGPPSALVNHDFTRGPWWPSHTVDVAWCTSFLQQVPKPYMRNYMEALRRAAIVLVSAPTTTEGAASGWHSVEIHDHDWWIVHFERYGFVFSPKLTTQVQEAARLDASQAKNRGPDGANYRTNDLAIDSMVFLNPRVSSRPRHDHLFPEIGCVETTPSPEALNGTLVRRECGYGQRGQKVEPTLAHEHLPPPVHEYLTDKWIALVKKNLPDGEHHALPEDVPPAMAAAASNPIITTPTNDTGDLLSRHAVTMIPQLVDAGNVAAAVARRIPVVVWPLWEFKHKPKVVTAEARHIEADGVEESPFLELSHDPNDFRPDVVWVGNTGYGHGWNLWCHKFREHVGTAQNQRRKLGLPTSWPIVIVDFTDYPNRQRCKAIEADVGPEFVTYTKRSMAKDRHWDASKNWVNEGHRLPDKSRGTEIAYRHVPLAVRTDTVQHVREALEGRNLSLRDNIEALHRPIDVTHLWPTDANVSKTVGTVQSNLRSTVSFAIAELGRSTPGLNLHVGLAGEVSTSGRNTVSSSYIEALLRSKILVVSQRDAWEDHYRLFEALVGGPLVMTDRMLGMPAELQNGTSIIEYTSATELKALILYYVKHDAERIRIASEGRRIAMSRHRSWHRMEEIVVGRPLTTCAVASSLPNAGGNCPYGVHANETLLLSRGVANIA